ncbi:MAG: glutamine-hydrolyzing carbamoyl-phosphate synthase small subunit [Coriobacteriales bacterium]|jgi:carbamoyl-phosphate synthase small subunit|nr:glutamine-hydrolyzing carbamoyl-phosphate synthase small subunit [Coriobacteriales bacterium]
MRADEEVNSDRIAVLMLEDGTCFVGTSSGAEGEAVGEINCNTAMVGYPEIISDSANAGQIVTLTYPQIGNYGITISDLESERLHLRGLIAKEFCSTPSNYRSTSKLTDLLVRQGIVALSGIDTRALSRYLREHGSMRAVISTVDHDVDSLLAKAGNSPMPSDENLVATVSTSKPYLYQMDADHEAWYGPLAALQYKVIVIDLGVMRTTLDTLTRLGCAVIVLPWNTSAAEVLAYQPQGVVFSTGPGDPRVVTPTIQTAAGLMGKLPILGLGLGHQVLALAAGGAVESLAVGHHGANYPVKDLISDRINITAQNHRFTVRFDTLGPVNTSWGKTVAANNTCGRILLSETDLKDQTVEGLHYLDIPAVSVQYHPEFACGPIEGNNVFLEFIKLINMRIKPQADGIEAISSMIDTETVASPSDAETVASSSDAETVASPSDAETVASPSDAETVAPPDITANTTSASEPDHA